MPRIPLKSAGMTNVGRKRELSVIWSFQKISIQSALYILVTASYLPIATCH